jgi:DNA-binding response OmpR family regulator
MSKPRILVVDDSPTQLMMYKMALSKEGYEIFTANNGVEGINRVYEDQFDLIISDIMMPEINGYVFCRLVKNDPMKAHIPIILLSGLGQQHDRFWGMEAGASTYLVKETNTSKLIAEVKHLLKTKVSGLKPFQSFSLHDIKDETNSDIRTKIFQILDRLLFHSSVSNKIRETVRYAYDVIQLKASLFRLLSNLMEYSVAVISFKLEGNNVFTVEVTEKTTQNQIKDIMRKTLKGERIETYKLTVRGKDKIGEDSVGEFKSELMVPLIENEVWLGFVGVYSTKENHFEEEDYKILNIFAKELVLIIQFIQKMSEMDRFRNDITNTLVNDLRKPINDSTELLDSLKGKGLSVDEVDTVIEVLKANLEKAHTHSEDLIAVLQKIKHDDIS